MSNYLGVGNHYNYDYYYHHNLMIMLVVYLIIIPKSAHLPLPTTPVCLALLPPGSRISPQGNIALFVLLDVGVHRPPSLGIY